MASADDHEFVLVLKRIFELSMLLEISNVMEDATAATGALEHRGHVIAIAMFCALDAISSYGYGRRNGKQIDPFVRAHFPEEYQPHANTLLRPTATLSSTAGTFLMLQSDQVMRPSHKAAVCSRSVCATSLTP